MLIKHKNLTWTLMLLFLPDVLCNRLKVEYQRQHVCTVKGSSAVIHCSFNHIDSLRMKSVQWGRLIKNHSSKSHYISRHISTSRYQNIGDKHHNCSLKIHKVNHNDKGLYAIRFLTSNNKSIWPDKVGPTLQVVDLNISMTKPHGNKKMKEGESVNLTCMNSCDGINVSSAFIWFKNGKPINEGPVLYLRNMSSANSGNYTCSLKTQTGATSRVMNIDVEYGPKNTSVSVRPSTEVDAGSNVTLICSSHANPPVENYTWFKIRDDDDIMDVGHQPVFFPGDGGQYLCGVTNKHGSQNSSVVTLKIKERLETATRDVLIIASVAVLLVASSVTAIIKLKKKRMRAPTSDCEENIQNDEYINWLAVCDGNQQETNQCEGRTTELVYASVLFNTERDSNTEQQIDSHNDDDDERVIYSTVCRNQHLNPSYIKLP